MKSQSDGAKAEMSPIAERMYYMEFYWRMLRNMEVNDAEELIERVASRVAQFMIKLWQRHPKNAGKAFMSSILTGNQLDQQALILDFDDDCSIKKFIIDLGKEFEPAMVEYQSRKVEEG